MDQERPLTKAKVVGKETVLHFPDGDVLLLGEIAIDCPACGKPYVLRIVGHHMRLVRNLLIEWIDRHPELTGTDAQIIELGRETIQGTAPANPENN